jgi:hypothetical protein
MENICLNHSLVVQLFQRPYGSDIQPFEKKAQLSCPDLHNLVSILRPLKTVLFQSLLPKAKAVAVPVQDFEYGAAAIAEHKEVSGKKIES